MTSNQPTPPRNCKEQASFQVCKQALLKTLGLSDKEFDQAYLEPLYQLVTYDPSIYPAVDGVRYFSTNPSPKWPSIRLIYTFDEKYIYLWFAELADEDEQKAEG